MESDFSHIMQGSVKDPNATEYYSQIMDATLMQKHVSMYNIETSVNNCMRCPLNEFVKPLSLGNGVGTSHLMVIGDSPTDVLSQYEGGSLIHSLLEQFQYNRDYIHFTSLVKCVGSTNYMDCHNHIVAEIIAKQPKVIIALGYNAAYPFMNHIANAVGQQLVPGAGYTLENGSDMIVVNHPKDIISNVGLLEELKNHLTMAFNHLSNKVAVGV